MTQIIGQNGAGWTPVSSADPGTTGNSLYWGFGYVAAFSGSMAFAHVTIGNAGAAGHKGTIYVYSGVGAGATFLAMSAEFPVDSTGDQSGAISGLLVGGNSYTLIFQGNNASSGAFTTANSGSSTTFGRQNIVANFGYRAGTTPIPAADVAAGHEFIIWIDSGVQTYSLSNHIEF